MIDMVDVIAVKPMDGFRLWLRFSDGSEGTQDLSSMIAAGGEMIAPLRDPELFGRVFIAFGVPSWPNGFDLDAINLHREMRAQGRPKKTAA